MDDGRRFLSGGGTEPRGYLMFSFVTPVGYVGNDQYSRSSRGRAFPALCARTKKGSAVTSPPLGRRERRAAAEVTSRRRLRAQEHHDRSRGLLVVGGDPDARLRDGIGAPERQEQGIDRLPAVGPAPLGTGGGTEDRVDTFAAAVGAGLGTRQALRGPATRPDGRSPPGEYGDDAAHRVRATDRVVADREGDSQGGRPSCVEQQPSYRDYRFLFDCDRPKPSTQQPHILDPVGCFRGPM